MIGRSLGIVLVAGSLALAGCASYQGSNERQGMLIGGVLGGVLGSQVGGGSGKTAATIIGTMIGSSIGQSVGQSMDELDRMKTAQTLENVRTGVSSEWRNPDTGYAYEVTPTRTYDSGGRPCREYSIDADIGGRTEQVYGTACRQPDGDWEIVN